MKTKIITIKREILTNDIELINFIENSMRHRRFLYNKGVEVIKSYGDRCNKYELDTFLYHTYEKNDPIYNNNTYAAGIRSCVVRDLKNTVDKVWKARKEGNYNASLKFTQANPYMGSFKVANKVMYKEKRMSSITNSKTVEYRANKTHHFTIYLKEPIFNTTMSEYMLSKHNRYSFRNSDIREIGFLKRNKKYYILLVVEASFADTTDIKKLPLCGIDLGIKNPITMFNGATIERYAFDNKTLARISHLMKRVEILSKILTRKMNRNIERGINPYSKNYERVIFKYRKTWERIYNIRKDWRFKTAHYIVNKYNNIVVDSFKQPKSEEKRQFIHTINTANRLHGMYLFNETLQYMAFKYNCIYHKAPSKTTKTCSSCGFVNESIPLKKRNIRCLRCNMKLDRDVNAAINCFKYLAKT